MLIVPNTGKILNGARANLRAASHVGDAAVDIGGYHFECGVREFVIWSRIVSTEPNLDLGGTKLAGAGLDLADVYVRMRERAFELAKGVAKTRDANRGEVSESLNAFIEISKPALQSPQKPTSSVGVSAPFSAHRSL